MWYLNTKSWEPWAFITNAFSAEECDKIITIADKLELEDAIVGSGKGLKKEYRSNKIGWFAPGPDTEWLYRKITDITTEINHQFWQFDLESIPELQFTKYINVNDQYKKHLDMGYQSVTYRKLSFSIQLTDENDYEGCNLEFFQSDNAEVAPRMRGAIVFFPSFIMHQVTPLLSGERNALVGWVCGPPFK